jgi:hypothetical protein
MEGAEEKNISGLLSDSNTGVWEVNIYWVYIVGQKHYKYLLQSI